MFLTFRESGVRENTTFFISLPLIKNQSMKFLVLSCGVTTVCDGGK